MSTVRVYLKDGTNSEIPIENLSETRRLLGHLIVNVVSTDEEAEQAVESESAVKTPAKPGKKKSNQLI